MIRAIFAILAAAFGVLTCGYFRCSRDHPGIHAVRGVGIVYKQLRLDTLDN